jgi:uncharacterized protein involved in type VI secretion and phage assembly
MTVILIEVITLFSYAYQQFRMRFRLNIGPKLERLDLREDSMCYQNAEAIVD